MKRSTYLLLLLTLILGMGFQCRKTNEEGGNSCYKGRLEIKGMCMNYTIKVLEGNIDPNLVQATWTDPQTGKTYQNVFGLQSYCNFPADLKEGDEFYFTVDTKVTPQECVVCTGFYPKPEKELYITVSKTSCN